MKFNSPVYSVIRVPIERVEANNYNPNKVASPEMDLLTLSIREDGYTQPIVTYLDPSRETYIIVDGFHRYRVMLENEDIRQREDGKLPCVVINKDINNRVASTIRHNRARGTHQVDSMSDIVINMRNNGWSFKKIGKKLGMDQDEVLRLSQLSGLAEMFIGREFSEAWEIELE